MSNLTLITGGAASGKSSFAVAEAAKLGGKVLFIATCQFFDEEMRAKIERHKAERPQTWTTVEAYKGIPSYIIEDRDNYLAIIVDCLTLLTSKMLEDENTDEEIIAEYQKIIKTAKSSPIPIFFVTNEVGSSVVPTNKVARRFRELQGRINAMVADDSDNVFLMVAGIPVRVK